MRKLVLTVCTIILLLVNVPANARSYPTFDWGLDASYGALYNDNILRFSEQDIDRYKHFDSRFATPVETLDDMENEFSLRPSFRWRAPMLLMVDGYYNIKHVERAKNSFTNYQTHTFSVSVRPRTRGYRWDLSYRVLRIPSYYLRVYRDRDYNQYHAARFRNWDHDVELDYRVNDSFWLKLSATTGTYYYNEKFTEYDSEYNEGGIGARIYLPGALAVYPSYIRRVSDNVGKNQEVRSAPVNEEQPVVEDTEYGDSDFNEDEFRITIRKPLGFIRFTVADAQLSYRLRRRVYTTNRSLADDPYHRGRLDNRFEITPKLDFRIARQLDASLYYTHEERETESDNEAVIQAKDFVRREFGLVLSYEIR